MTVTRILRRRLRSVVDHWLRPFDLKMVNRARSPRGCFDALARIRRAGLRLELIIDVGASDGKWTAQCMKVCPDARYRLIEARAVHGPALAALKARCPNVAYDICTVGAGAKSVALYEHGNQTSVLSSEYCVSSDTTVSTVEMRTIDFLLSSQEIRGPALLKLDVQGYELEVLRGCERLLADSQLQLLLTEVSLRRIYESSPLAHEVIQFAARHGFRIFDICSYCPRPHDRELAQCDLLFARHDSKLFAHEGWQ